MVCVVFVCVNVYTCTYVCTHWVAVEGSAVGALRRTDLADSQGVRPSQKEGQTLPLRGAFCNLKWRQSFRLICCTSVI